MIQEEYDLLINQMDNINKTIKSNGKYQYSHKNAKAVDYSGFPELPLNYSKTRGNFLFDNTLESTAVRAYLSAENQDGESIDNLEAYIRLKQTDPAKLDIEELNQI